MLITDDQLKSVIMKVNLLDQHKLDELIQYAKNSQLNLTDALIEKDIITDENLGILIADAVKIPFIVLGKISIPDDVFKIIPERIARKYKVIPF
jgi:type IV pilus assembly protein PilB